MMRRIYLSVLFIALCSAAQAQSVRTWVSTTGSDSNPCTRALPCRNFGAAVAAVAPGGEVVVLDSGGYGPVTVDKSVAIIAAGLHAAIAPTAGAAVTVNVTDTERIVLRGLYLNGQGGDIGIDFQAGELLEVESCVISGFSEYGLRFEPSTSATLFVTDVIVRNNHHGIRVASGETTPEPPDATIVHTKVVRNSVGIWAFNGARVNIANSVVATNTFGIHGGNDGTSAVPEVNIDNCLVSDAENVGIGTQSGAIISVSNCLVSHNGFGIQAIHGGLIRVSTSTITRNHTGVSGTFGGTVLTFGNNRLAGNLTEGAFNDSIVLQ